MDETCWICGVKMPSMKIREALKEDPTFLDGHTHFGSLSRFDNESHCCDECGETEAVAFILSPLSNYWKAWIKAAMDEAQKAGDRDNWRAAVCMARGSLIGHHEWQLETFQNMMEKLE
jgi:hypothetical protein